MIRTLTVMKQNLASQYAILNDILQICWCYLPYSKPSSTYTILQSLALFSIWEAFENYINDPENFDHWEMSEESIESVSLNSIVQAWSLDYSRFLMLLKILFIREDCCHQPGYWSWGGGGGGSRIWISGDYWEQKIKSDWIIRRHVCKGELWCEQLYPSARDIRYTNHSNVSNFSGQGEKFIRATVS